MNKAMVKEASIFFSDIVGYSSMIARDEKGALQLLDEHDIILEAHIAKNKGHIIKHIGDAIFAEFADSDSAVKTAIGIQAELKERNSNATGKDQIIVRIGLHYGNVVVKGDDLFGNDVNLCARIEPTAIPGGIAISSISLSNMVDKAIFTRSYGHVRMKNIPNPMELFRVYIDKNDYLSEDQDDLIKTLIGRGVKIVDKNEKTHSYKTVAILYPENLGEQEEEFFCYGFLEHMINDLKTIDGIRTPSIFDVKKYKDSKDSISQISIDLAVQYIAQLSILSVGDKFKINIILTSMSTGEEILSESFDGQHNEMQIISGKIISQFADRLSVDLSETVKELFQRENKVDNEAYKIFLEGKYLFDIRGSADSIEKSAKLFKKALKIDNEFSECHAMLGMLYNFMGELDDAEDELEEALDIAEDSDNYDALSIIYNNMGIYYKEQKRFEKSIKFFNKGIKLQKTLPNDDMKANLLHNMSGCYGLMGDFDKRFIYLEKSQAIYEKLEDNIRLGNSYGEMGNAYKSSANNEKAIEYYEKAKQIFAAEEMTSSIAQVLLLQSEIYLFTNDYQKAKENLDKAFQISEEFDIPMMEARIYLGYGKLYSQENKIDDALDNLNEALDIFMDINNKLRASDVLIMMGFLYIKKKKNRKAEKAYKRAKKLIGKIEGSYHNPSLDKLGEEIEKLDT